MKAWSHFCTITKHKILVAKYCFRIGLYKQGMLHDMSKYSPTEFLQGCRYYQGTRSPNNAEREATGVSLSWLHHKGRNRHHYEYWIDYGTGVENGMQGMRMPERYVAEMICDRIAASKVYNKENYTDACPLAYYERGKQYAILHPDTRAQLERVLKMLAEEGEEKALSYVKEVLLQKKVK